MVLVFFVSSLLAGTLSFAVHVARAQSDSDQTNAGASAGANTVLGALPNETPAQTKARLQSALAEVQQEEEDAKKTLADAQGQSASLARDISVLNAQIKVAELNIKAKNLLIQTLGQDINDKQKTINTLIDKINSGKDTIAQLIRKTNELDAVSIPEVVLSEKNLTTLFSDFDTFQSVQASLQATINQVADTQNQTQVQKDQLTSRQNQAIDAKAAILQDEKNIQTAQAQKKALLNISKNNEKSYAAILAQKRAKAASIEAALFALRDTSSISFKDALRFANDASKITGVRPAFLLAILTQESALGANVGSCYVQDLNTGVGKSANDGRIITNVMKPGRDTVPFQAITSALGLNPLKTLVSCPQSVGWGGAMGPAQFIPSTWQLFAPRIQSALNVTLANPWNPRDAFMASAIYLSDLGAINGSYTGEKNAACKYYSGRSCSASKMINSYGTQVISKATNIQTNMIDPLQGL